MDGEDVGVDSGSPGTENHLHFHKDRDADGEEAYTNTVEGRSYESSAKIRSVGMGGSIVQALYPERDSRSDG